jgi:hypothetical protein
MVQDDLSRGNPKIVELQAKNGVFKGASSGCRGTLKKISPTGL